MQQRRRPAALPLAPQVAGQRREAPQQEQVQAQVQQLVPEQAQQEQVQVQVLLLVPEQARPARRERVLQVLQVQLELEQLEQPGLALQVQVLHLPGALLGQPA